MFSEILSNILSNSNLYWVIIGSMMLAIASSLIGTFAWLNKQSLIGDVLAHCTLPGITIGFLLFHSRNPAILLPAAMISSLTGNFLVNWFVQKVKITPDSALAIVLSGYFAIGATLLSYIQQLPISGKSGIDHILFGQAAALDDNDVLVLVITAVILCSLIIIFFKKLTLVSFDKDYAKTINKHSKKYHQLIGIMIVSCVVIGIQIVGVILMSALLIFPAIIARQWTESLSKLLLIASIIAIFASLVGVNLSWNYQNIPTGPAIVVTLGSIIITTLLISPRCGLIIKYIQEWKNQKKIDGENIIRSCYLIQQNNNAMVIHKKSNILKERSLPINNLNQGIDYALNHHWLIIAEDGYQLTIQGLKIAEKITRYHRLWEKYLKTNKKLSEPVLHLSAENAEHIIDEQLGDLIDNTLGNPPTDPHGKKIPKK